MLRQCVVLDEQIINIGEWDYDIQSIEIAQTELDNEGNVLKEAIYDNRIGNPLPEGAQMVEMEVEEDEDGGWRVVGQPFPKCTEQRIKELEDENALLGLELAQTHINLKRMEAEHASLLFELVDKGVI